jgi:rSAM/selenodomain-associated transferase 1
MLLIFLKYPEPGRVKTRLAETIGAERAAALYRRWIDIVLDQLQVLRTCIQLVAYFDGAPHDAFHPWHQLADHWWPQPVGDLGDRLSAGFASAFDLGGPVIAVGTDCLEMAADLIEHAFAELHRHDVVFGAASDGGYYLVGTAQNRPTLFRSVRWSSTFTLDDHLRRCQEEGWSVSILPMRHDIDTWHGWQAYLLRAGQSSHEEDTKLSRRHPEPE